MRPENPDERIPFVARANAFFQGIGDGFAGAFPNEDPRRRLPAQPVDQTIGTTSTVGVQSTYSAQAQRIVGEGPNELLRIDPDLGFNIQNMGYTRPGGSGSKYEKY